MNWSRRDILNAGLASPVLFAVSAARQKNAAGHLDQSLIAAAPGRVEVPDDPEAARTLALVRKWDGPFCQSTLTNRGQKPVRVREVVLFDATVSLDPQTSLYGEGFQMLSQTGGTIGRPVDLGNYTDAKHYRIPEPAGATTCYGVMMLASPRGAHSVLGFSSCRRFCGKLHINGSSVRVVVDTENIVIDPGETWQLEEFFFQSSHRRDIPLARLAARLNHSHPPLEFASPPTGWCSWYCFGPRVTAQQVLENLDFIAAKIPQLKYIQIDDGYQPAMGDWLETGSAFGGDVQGVLKEIRKRSFEPAIWVAPFIAEERSNLFQRHPSWFVKDETGKPLRADRVTFGGWRRGPWYAVDGTHPEAQEHLETVFRTMRREWGCTYFKLDANFWGAIHGGRFYDPRASRIEAYRRGMQAVIRGAGDAFILGCNHPIWPSLGLIHGSRSSNDIKRSWDRVKTTARQNLSRNWQNRRLWWNDPDAIVLTGDLSEDEFRFHATAIYATGGMVLSGDDLTRISAERLKMLKKLLPPAGAAATFQDDSLRVGEIIGPKSHIFLFNWSDAPENFSFNLPVTREVTDFWTGESYGRRKGAFEIKDVAAHSARLLVCK